MLPRSGRLSIRQFDSVIELGRVMHSSFFLIRVLKEQKDTRIAAVAPKKIAKTAVVRNRIRRKIYGAVREFKGSIRLGIHVIIFAKSSLTAIKQPEIASDLKNFFVKNDLLS